MGETKKKIVFEFDIYTDGKCSSPVKEMPRITSRYFDEDLFEFTKNGEDDCRHAFKRVFDFDKAGKKEFLDLCDFLERNTHSRREYVVEGLNEFYGKMIYEANRLCREEIKSANDFTDGNYELNFDFRIVETNAKKIKEVIYEED